LRSVLLTWCVERTVSGVDVDTIGVLADPDRLARRDLRLAAARLLKPRRGGDDIT